MNNLNIQKIKINKLIPAEYNPRKLLKSSDSEFKKIKRSIEKFGYVDPIIVNKDMTIIGGHQRFNVIKELDYKEIDCVVLDISKEDEKALNIALNKISGSWDDEKIKALLKDLKDSDFEMSLTGFDESEINQILKKSLNEDEFNIEESLEKETISQNGDLWFLGRHRLICGDSTNNLTLDMLMENKKANVIITDPPYGVSYESKQVNKNKMQTLKNDDLNDEKLSFLLLESFKNGYNNLTDDGVIYIFHSDVKRHLFYDAMIKAKFKYSNTCYWIKNNASFGFADYRMKHEPVFYAFKGVESHKWYGGRTCTTVWEFNTSHKNDLHPTMKPIELLSYPILNSSLENSIILDLFGGSGSTLIASEQTNRICYMCEIDEKYTDVIVNRYINFTNNKDNVYLFRNNEKICYNDVINK